MVADSNLILQIIINMAKHSVAAIKDKLEVMFKLNLKDDMLEHPTQEDMYKHPKQLMDIVDHIDIKAVGIVRIGYQYAAVSRLCKAKCSTKFFFDY